MSAKVIILKQLELLICKFWHIGSSKIDKDASIRLERSTIEGNFKNKQGKIVHAYSTGIKITTKGLPLQIVGDKSYNGYIIKQNRAQIIVNGNFLLWNYKRKIS